MIGGGVRTEPSLAFLVGRADTITCCSTPETINYGRQPLLHGQVMKRTSTAYGIVFLLGIIPVAWLGLESNTDKSSDEMLIRETVVALYIKGLQTRDFGLIRTICIPEAVLMSVGDDDKLRVTSLETWSKRFAPAPSPFERLDYTILSIDAAGTAAQVKILFMVDGNRRVIDYLNMLKIEGRWRVVNIIDF